METKQRISGKELVEILSRYEFNAEQKEQIRDGAELGLTREQIEIYALPHFNYRHMQVMCHALKWGLSLEQVNIIADSRLDWYAMHSIFRCLRDGVCPDVVRLVLAERRNYEAAAFRDDALFEIIYALAENGWIRTEEERNGDKIKD